MLLVIVVKNIILTGVVSCSNLSNKTRLPKLLALIATIFGGSTQIIVIIFLLCISFFVQRPLINDDELFLLFFCQAFFEVEQIIVILRHATCSIFYLITLIANSQLDLNYHLNPVSMPGFLSEFATKYLSICLNLMQISDTFVGMHQQENYLGSTQQQLGTTWRNISYSDSLQCIIPIFANAKQQYPASTDQSQQGPSNIDL